ncbi:hypothetical protein LTR70_004483 [Exophiala xenobiotica]|uniref:Glycosyl transferase CAP10 domain-containing protein n=1 Tax=Lithohypha guttulata TaxID=1690604 RepID=A0ABR0KEP2_9EURO|nr:hypothetical protein LTR24_003961 [Lithohypha guttulata]KAK5320905.1 hypothetical protein LTR70_004483 [Exophiala xenobiotica]
MISRPLTVTVGCLLAFVLFARFAFFPTATSPDAQGVPAELNPWTFVPAQHAKLHSLSPSQCTASFPGLYDRILATAGQRTVENGLITYDEVRIASGRCMLQVLVYEGELYITDLGDPLECYVSNGRERIVATLSLIQRAIASSPQPVPNIEFPLSYDDLPTRSTPGVTWGYTRKETEDNVWLMPDYGYWSWWAIGIPSFNSMSRSISAVDASTPWRKKIPRAVWRGTPHYAPALREKLIETTKDKPWADVKTVTIGQDERHFLSLNDHCRYQYVLQTEGTSYSGRFKFLQLCNSVTVSHKLEYAEFATHLMNPSGPKQNFIQVQRDWSDLEEKMQYFERRPKEAEAIAARSRELFADRYLTPAAVSCYLRQMIEAWAKLQGFEPQLCDINKTTGAKTMRGVPFEAFIVSFPQEKPGEYGRFAPG